MNSTFVRLVSIHLWREWRTHRRAVLGLAIVLPLICSVLRLLQGAHPCPAEWITMFAVIPALLVGSDLFASERQRGGDVFLQRMPTGLHAAYLGKLVFFVALIGSAALYGGAIGRVLFAEQASRASTALFGASGSQLALGAGIYSLWVFAASTWVRSSVQSFPVAAVFLSAMMAPAAYFAVAGQGSPSSFEPTGGGALLLDVETGELIPAGSASGSKWRAPRELRFSDALTARRGWPMFGFDGLCDAVHGNQADNEAERQIFFDALQLQTPDVALTLETPSAAAFFDAWEWPEELDPRLPSRSSLRYAGIGFRCITFVPERGPVDRYWDPARRCLMPETELERLLEVDDVSTVHILPAGWLVQGDDAWHLLDPESGDVHEPPLLQSDDRIFAVLDDGSLLVERAGSGLRCVDLQTRVTFPVHSDPNVYVPAGIPCFSNHQSAPLLSDRPSLGLAWIADTPDASSTTGARLALFDPTSNEIRVLPELSKREWEHGPVIRAEGKDFYLVQYSPFELFRIDRDSGKSTLILDLHEM